MVSKSKLECFLLKSEEKLIIQQKLFKNSVVNQTFVVFLFWDTQFCVRTIYLEPVQELDNYLGKIYCISVL